MKWTCPLLLVLAALPAPAQDPSPDQQFHALPEALQWLKRHQAEDGSWRVTEYVDCCGKDKTIEGRCTPNPGDPTYDIGVTSLAILAFLWNGDAAQPPVARGIEWLKKQQAADGSLEGPADKKNFYNHVLATLALVENHRLRMPKAERKPVFDLSDEDRRRILGWIDQLSAEAPADRERATDALSREFDKAERILEDEAKKRSDPETLSRIQQVMGRNFVTCTDDPPAARALSYLLAQQNPGKGWRTFGPRDTNESSITGWASLTLLAAAREKMIRHLRPLKGALDWFDEVMSADGRIGYTEKPEERNEEDYPSHLALIPLANLVRLSYGRSPSDGAIARGTRWLEKYTPEWDRNSLKADFTYWFLGACMISQMDGAKGERWARWKTALERELSGHQVRLKGICRTGSWEPMDFWSESAGRVYTTAMGALVLLVCEGKAPRFSMK